VVTTRFVILHHRERSGEHWDLMIEQPESLATWRLVRLPSPDDPRPIPAERLPDHRKVYLTYEGPVSGDRGEVTRVDEGGCEILTRTDAEWRVHFEGACLGGLRIILRLPASAPADGGCGAEAWEVSAMAHAATQSPPRTAPD